MSFTLHPFLVHFPIAFIFGAFILHTIHLIKSNWIHKTTGLWLVGLSAIFSIFSSITGEWELKKATEKNYSTEVTNLMNQHEIFGNVVTWGSIIFFIFWMYLFYNYKDDRRIDIIAFAFLFLLGSESYIPSTSVAFRNSTAFTFSAISAAVPLVL